MFLRKTILAVSLAVLVSACTAPLEMTAEEKSVLGQSWNAPLPDQQGGPSISDARLWWASWNDPELLALTEAALRSNTDVRTALANLKAAAALSDAATAALFPSADVSGNANRQNRGGNTTDSFSAQASLSWSWSLVGGNVAAKRAANYEALASAMTLEDTKIAVVSEVAQDFINLRLAEVKRVITEKKLRNFEQAAQIAQWRFEAGLATQTEVDQAAASRDSIRAQVPVCDVAIAKYRNALARLCVMNVSDLPLKENALVPVAPENLAVKIPAETLRQRPDMRAAEFSVQAAGERVYEAKSNWFPTLQISGNLGTQAATIGALGASGTGIAALIGALSVPLFNWNDQVSAVQQKEAALEKARAAYTAVLVKALEETENALNGISAAKRRTEDLESSLASAKSSADLALMQYRSGLTDYQTVLSTQQSLFSAEEGLEENKADLATNFIKLFLALGGGWKSPEAQQQS